MGFGKKAEKSTEEHSIFHFSETLSELAFGILGNFRVDADFFKILRLHQLLLDPIQTKPPKILQGNTGHVFRRIPVPV